MQRATLSGLILGLLLLCPNGLFASEADELREKAKAIRKEASELAEQGKMSKDLKRRGFRFVGSTICYAFMQAAGVIQGRTANGRKDWRNSAGKTLKEIQEAATDTCPE